MKKINFAEHILPHLIAIIIFLVVTVMFFSPVFFENKTLNQHDITQSIGASKALVDYRKETGEEGLWAPNMFSGMPAYLITVQWGNKPIGFLKVIMGFALPHPVNNIFLAFLCYYILLLSFRVRPYLAIAGALAFGLSSYMMVGLAAGHNARIGAIAFMPVVMAGIHLAFSGRRIIGFGLTSAGLALHLRENHLQITYYLVLIVLVYGLVQLIYFIRENKIVEFAKSLGLLILAAGLAAGTFFAPLWAVTEYSQYTIRGKSELASPSSTAATDGLGREYAFEYSNGILEPMTLLIPNFYGGSSMDNIFANPDGKVRKALTQQGIQYDPQQMAQSAYWGAQPVSAPYFGGAIIFFLFVLGIIFSDKKMVWWLVPLCILAIMLSWGSNFASFNHFMFDNLPGYNKFRSVTFTIIIVLFAMPLLGLTGLERLFEKGISKETKRKLLIALAGSGGLCLLVMLAAGTFSFLKDAETGLPAWFLEALREDRKSLMRSDALRSLAFILPAFIMIYFAVWKKTPAGFYAFLIFFTAIDMIGVDRRHFTKEKFQSKRRSTIEMSPADQQVLNDKSYYRVLNFSGAWSDALTSYYHNSVGGYHGAKLRRYQDLYDSCIEREMNRFADEFQTGRGDFSRFPVLNMLNTKYILYGNNRSNMLPNPQANGPAWFVSEIMLAKSPGEELSATRGINSKKQAVIDGSKFKIQQLVPDSASVIRLTEHKPNYLKYEATTATPNLAVFSEIYYPAGWLAFIDGKEVPILCANYVLRALEIPAGTHVIEFRFEPRPYFVGNKITAASSWIVILLLLGSLGWSWRTLNKEPESQPA
jgi:hypothetical protein